MKRKGWVFFLLFSVVVNMLSVPLVVNAQEQIYIYEDSDGSIIEYFLDEDGMPYNYCNGEKIYIALPLEHLKVTDENLINELNEGIREKNILSRAVPTQYVDLSTSSGLDSSPTYTKDISFSSGNVHSTDYLKFNTQHEQIRFKTTNIVQEHILAGYDISFIFYHYNEVTDEWYNTTMTDVNCTSINGVGIKFTASVHPYGKFTIIKSSDWKSATVNIWTSPLW